MLKNSGLIGDRINHLPKKVPSETLHHLAPFNYRMAPTMHELSPADILFNRKLKMRMPALLETNVKVIKDLDV